MRAGVVAMLLGALTAHADDGAVRTVVPTQKLRRVVLAIPPWILHSGSLRFDATGELEMSTARVAKPLSIAPDLWFGATDGLTLGVVDSRYAQTGFRGAAGGAFCVTGTAAGCPTLYNNIGLEAWQALLRGPESLVIGGGGYATNIQRGFYAAKLGLKSKITEGRLALTTMPSVLIAVNDRHVTNPNTDVLYVPVALALKLSAAATFAIGSGIKGPVDDFRHKWQIPLGASASYAIGPVLLGASWTFGTFDAAAENPAPPAPPIKGTDLRVVQGWLSYTWIHTPKRPAPVAVEVAIKPANASLLAPTQTPAQTPAEPDSKPPSAAFPGTDALPEATIATLASEHAPELTKCEGSYELSGEVTIAFAVNSKGRVTKTQLSSTIANISVTDCLLGAIRNWQFPAQSNAASGTYTITYR